MSTSSLPVVVIGAGPVGLAAAAHLLARGRTPLMLESGDRIGAGVRSWSAVQMFSPWRFNIDAAARALLDAEGWVAPDPDRFPTGAELVADYLEPLAATGALAGTIHLGARVVSVTRSQIDLMTDANRNTSAFSVRYTQGSQEIDVLAQAVIDASGTIANPNPVGAAGIVALGERDLAARIHYGLPDVLGVDRNRYAGRRVLVVGSGHSAFNVLADLATLRADCPNTQIVWAVRKASANRVLGGGENDQLKARGRLGLRIAGLIEQGQIQVHTGVHADRIEDTAHGLIVRSYGRGLPAVDEIIAVTGFRPDLSILREVRLSLDPATQSPTALAPLIDPNLHSCGTVRPHGARELQHPDRNLYIAGMKSYGRAPTFLLLTGHEQVRSIAAAIAGDWEAARRTELVLPETGVCRIDGAANDDELSAWSAACCGGPAPGGSSACCDRDARAKAGGADGCGCSSVESSDTVSGESPVKSSQRSGCCAPARA